MNNLIFEKNHLKIRNNIIGNFNEIRVMVYEI